jgi:hypothetical protein
MLQYTPGQLQPNHLAQRITLFLPHSCTQKEQTEAQQEEVAGATNLAASAGHRVEHMAAEDAEHPSGLRHSRITHLLAGQDGLMTVSKVGGLELDGNFHDGGWKWTRTFQNGKEGGTGHDSMYLLLQHRL